MLGRRHQVTEAEQRLRHLYVDQSRLDIAGLVRLVTTPDTLGGLLRTPNAGQRTAAVSEVRVRLGLHRVEVGGERRRDVAPRGAQRRLGEGDRLPVLPHEQRLVDEQRYHVGAESPVPARLGQAQRLVEVALGEAVRVGVVGADARDGHQPPVARWSWRPVASV